MRDKNFELMFNFGTFILTFLMVILAIIDLVKN